MPTTDMAVKWPRSPGAKGLTQGMNMDNYALLIKAVAAVVCTITLTVGGCVANSHRLVSKDIAAGASPMAASCAHGVAEGTTGICQVIAAKVTP